MHNIIILNDGTDEIYNLNGIRCQIISEFLHEFRNIFEPEDEQDFHEQLESKSYWVAPSNEEYDHILEISNRLTGTNETEDAELESLIFKTWEETKSEFQLPETYMGYLNHISFRVLSQLLQWANGPDASIEVILNKDTFNIALSGMLNPDNITHRFDLKTQLTEIYSFLEEHLPNNLDWNNTLWYYYCPDNVTVSFDIPPQEEQNDLPGYVIETILNDKVITAYIMKD